METPSPTAAPRRAGSPFDDVRPDVVIALTAAAVALLWATVDALPGGRWVAVHVFTLGVVTPLIVAFSHHQAETVLRARPRDRTALRVGLTAGPVTLVLGVALGVTSLIGVGATVVTAAVVLSWWRLRLARRGALAPRFAWVVRSYERAHGAFVHGGVLGALLGLGLIPGSAYLAVRLAHLHAMVLGFAGVTLLATVVLYGPTLLRAQLRPGADTSGARWLRTTATATTVAVIGLLGTALRGPAGPTARWVAAGALAVAACGAASIAAPLVRTVAAKGRAVPLPGVLLTAAIVWLAIGVALDAVLVAAGAWRYLDALGAVVLLGALSQAITATLLHVGVSWLPRDRRLRTRARVDGAPWWLPVVPQVGVVAGVVVALN